VFQQQEKGGGFWWRGIDRVGRVHQRSFRGIDEERKSRDGGFVREEKMYTSEKGTDLDDPSGTNFVEREEHACREKKRGEREGGLNKKRGGAKGFCQNWREFGWGQPKKGERKLDTNYKCKERKRAGRDYFD